MKKLSLSFAIVITVMALLLPPAGLAQSTGEAVVRTILFYSPSCGHCHYVIAEVLPPITEEYGDQLQIVGIDTSQPEGAALYQDAIERFQIPAERRGVPTLIVGETVLVGSGEIPEQFPDLVEEFLTDDGVDWPDLPGLREALAATAEPAPGSTPAAPAAPTATPAPSPPAAATPAAAIPAPPDRPSIYLTYFFDPTCLECARVSADLEEMQARYPNLVVEKLDVNQEAALNEALSEKYDVPEADRLMAPAIFIGDVFLAPDEITAARLEALIAEPAAAALSPPEAGLDVSEEAAAAGIVNRFERFGVLAVAGAGLLDGVNPCAFTTIIFFVSYLAVAGRKGREIIFVGAAFTLAVFLTYLTLGLGLAEVARQMSAFTLIGQIIYGATALLCLVLAVISVGDYLKIRRGQLNEIALQLPLALKKRIHGTIRSRTRMQGFIGAAFVAGILVSIFELACTGQVYLPTIVFVTGVAEKRWAAIAYLLLYNLMFVLPLVAVFMVTYLGTSSRQLTTFFQRHAGAVKLLTASLFGVLAVWLGYMVVTI